MKLSKKLKLLTIVLLSLSVFFIYKHTNYNNINYTVLGDSLSKGIDCYGRIDYGYSDYIKDYLQEINKLKTYSKKYTDENMTIEKLYNTIITDKKMSQNITNNNIRDVLRDSNYITMTIGLNDLLYKLSMTNEFTEANLDIIIKEIDMSFALLIEEIRKVYNREIYIIGYYDVDANNKFFKSAIKKLNNIFKKNDNVTYISTYELSENRNVFLPNPSSYNPNYKGYKVISNKIINKMSKKLEN